MIPISTMYEQDRARLRLYGEINNQSIFSLCDEIQLAVQYYQYRDIDLHIDSPGGAIASLEYYLTQLQMWREQYRVRIHTLALTNVSSAAALMVSLGDVGNRRALKSSRLLYHNARILSSNNATWTTRDLDQMSQGLHQIEQNLLQKLVDHIYTKQVESESRTSILMMQPDIHDISDIRDHYEDYFIETNGTADNGLLTRHQLETAYRTLQRLEIFISPEIAQKMLLIDTVVTELGS